LGRGGRLGRARIRRRRGHRRLRPGPGGSPVRRPRRAPGRLGVPRRRRRGPGPGHPGLGRGRGRPGPARPAVGGPADPVGLTRPRAVGAPLRGRAGRVDRPRGRTHRLSRRCRARRGRRLPGGARAAAGGRMTDGLHPVVEAYIDLGLALGRHIDGLVDAYYGPPEAARRAEAGPPVAPGVLARRAADLLTELDHSDLADGRRRWLRAQVVGLHTTAEKLSGRTIGYADEVELCYGVRPRRVDEDVFAAAHRRLDGVLPGSGALAER